jgi:hypothetical protein
MFTLFVGCKSTIKESQSYINKQEAIDMALEIASSPHPEISGAQITPHNINAQQMTFDEAVKKLNENNEVPSGQDPNMIVWYITMEGIWQDEFPRPEDFPTPTAYHRYTIILDAKTGLYLEISASP